MSHNLCLFAGKTHDLSLFQTPTSVTDRAMATQKPREVYFEYLDGLVAAQRPKLHPRSTERQIRNAKSGPAWREYEAYKTEIEEHKAQVDAFLAKHPDAKWGNT